MSHESDNKKKKLVVLFLESNSVGVYKYRYSCITKGNKIKYNIIIFIKVFIYNVVQKYIKYRYSMSIILV